jgi:hypothetical protein
MDSKPISRHTSSRRALAHCAFLLRQVLAEADGYLPLEELLVRVRLRFNEALPAPLARELLHSDARLRSRLFIRSMQGRDHYYLAPADSRRSSRSLPDYPLVRVVQHQASACQGRRLNAIERFAQGL